MADATCSGLQLANFWQDVGEDVGRGRIYIPLEDVRRFKVSEEQITGGKFSREFRELMRFEVDRTREMLLRGEELLPLVERRVRGNIAPLWTWGGWRYWMLFGGWTTTR